MSKRPIIGIPTQVVQSFGGIPADFPPSWAMSQRYIHALTAAGAIPWMIPLLPEDIDTLRAICADPERAEDALCLRLLVSRRDSLPPCHEPRAALGSGELAFDAVQK